MASILNLPTHNKDQQGLIHMYKFTRQTLTSDSFKGKQHVDRDLKTHPVYGPLVTGQALAESPLTKHINTREAIQIGRRALGDVLWQRLIEVGGKETLSMAAEVIDDHLYLPDPTRSKDLQLNLVTNIVKELSTQDSIHKSKFCSLAEETIRKLQLDPSFKKEVEDALINDGSIYSPWLIIHRQKAA